jgi:ParB family chromosome partitioning protein
VGDTPDAGVSEATGGVHNTPIELIRRNPDQPRKVFAEADIEELAASIREKGVLQPILVRPAPGAEGEFQIVAGERRWRAAQKAGLKVLPTVVRDLDDLEVLEIGIIENVQRADLNIDRRSAVLQGADRGSAHPR